MSAICGILGRGGALPDLQALSRMMGALEKHGPDGQRTWHDAQIGLGHQMLHITPESLTENLPLHHSASAVTLTADARLDNRDELLPALGMAPSVAVTDSALLLQAYLKWGKACAERLVGEFSAAIWDARERRLHLVTDPMGVRPLFYTEVAGRYFAFASEVEALLRLETLPPAIDRRRLAMLGVSAMTVYLEPERTCFEGVRRIPAASVLSVGDRGIDRVEYWRPDAGRRLHLTSDGECREAFQDVFFKAVRSRLRSAFPVASLLSGGLDSSAIVGAAGRILGQEKRRLMTLSSVPEPAATSVVVDEREYIEQFRDTPNLDMHYESAPGSGPFDHVEELVKSASLCSYGYQHYMYTALVRAARHRNARVILDGDSGEYTASAYLRGYMAELLLSGKWQTLIRELRQIAPDQRLGMPLVKREVLRPLVPYRVLKAFGRHRKFRNLVAYPIREQFVRDVLGMDLDPLQDELFRLLSELPNHRKNMVRTILQGRRDIRQRSHAGFVDYQLARFTYPYLDKRVIEFGLAVDGRFKYQGGQSRRLLRLGMQGLIPEPIRSRTSKAPFCPDYHLRYERDKPRASTLMKQLRDAEKLRTIIDFERTFKALEKAPEYRTNEPMTSDYAAQFLVPYTLYLCYFLHGFRS